MFAKILVDVKAKEVNRLFDYIIPGKYLSELEKGMRVIVPFGEQLRLGFVIDIVNESNLAKKEIIDILDIIPTISEEAFLYINYLNKTNSTLYINVLETILPSELFINYEQHLIVKNKELLPLELKEFVNRNNIIKVDKKLDDKRSLIKRLIKDNILELKKVYKKKIDKKEVITYYYNDIYHNYPRLNNYKDLIEFIKNNPYLTLNELKENGFSESSIKTLEKNNILLKELKVIDRDVRFIETNKTPIHELNQEQLNAYNLIINTFNTDQKTLLHGVTGSGKTEVYMHLIKEALRLNKKVLYLVPEISLVAQTVNYLKSRFNESITHYNSNLSSGEKYDSWLKIIDDEAKIIVGTRSSIFLPINDLGIIIVDEEHDNSYNQIDRVQYNLIDILNIKAKYNNSPVILGSATPKVSSMYYALNKKYNLAKLTKRATNAPLPNINFVDMRNELLNGNIEIFSNLLKSKINDRLKKNEQVILLYNRKGYSQFVLCRACGNVSKCPNCDVSLTYYKGENELRCGYCNFKVKKESTCKVCGSNKIGEVGLGVEQVFERVKKTFKDARVVLMDAKSTAKKGMHERIWLDFKDHKYDILVGTQMVSKGLDFPNVTLVGILMADLELKVPNYLAYEQTYNLLTQMVGRSGRSSFGEAVIQGYDLEHFAIKSVNKPYDIFYKQAIYQREISKYEPFYQMSQILVTSDSYLKAYQTAFKMKKILTDSDNIVLGPTEPIIKYIKNEYRFVITIKAKQMNYEKIMSVINEFNNNSKVTFLNIPQVI